MGLYRKGKMWWFIKQYKGKRIEESLGTPIKKLAEQKFAEILPKILDSTYGEVPIEIPIEVPKPLMKEIMQRYMNEVSPLQKSHSRNVEIISHWYDYIGDRTVPEVTISLLSSYKAKRLTGEIRYGKGKGRKAGQTTVKRELSFLRQIFNKAIDEWGDDWNEYFKNNPFNPVKKVIKKMGDVKRIRYVMPEEAQSLRFIMPAWLRPMVIVGCQTGLRVGNIVRLTTWEVDFHNDRISIVGEKMKNGNPFAMKMTSVVKTTLMDVIRARKVVSPYIFCDANGEPYSVRAVSMAFHRACEKAGVKDLHFHDLRHDFATLLINSGATLYQVQHQLGQADPRMAQRYAHLLPENINVVDRIEGKGTAAILTEPEEEKTTTILRQSG